MCKIVSLIFSIYCLISIIGVINVKTLLQIVANFKKGGQVALADLELKLFAQVILRFLWR